MNAITFRAAYSFFPVNTFVSMSGVCFEDDTFNGASAKYRRRGYDLRGSVEERAFPGLGDEVLCQERYVGDKYTWVVNFDTEYVDYSTTAHPLIVCCKVRPVSRPLPLPFLDDGLV